MIGTSVVGAGAGVGGFDVGSEVGTAVGGAVDGSGAIIWNGGGESLQVGIGLGVSSAASVGLGEGVGSDEGGAGVSVGVGIGGWNVMVQSLKLSVQQITFCWFHVETSSVQAPPLLISQHFWPVDPVFDWSQHHWSTPEYPQP